MTRPRSPLSFGRSAELQPRPGWNDASWVDVCMTHVVVPLDVVNVDRSGNSRHEIQATHVLGDVRKILETIAIAFEVAEVHRVEACERREQ